MKKKIFFFIAFLQIDFLIGNDFLEAQWQPEVRLTNSSGNGIISYPNARSMLSNGDTIHLVWYDNRDGNDEIYYKRSLNAGISWESDLRLTTNSGSSTAPCIAAYENTINVCWSDNRDGNFEIYCKRSSNGGTTWNSDTRLTNSTGFSAYPCLSGSGMILNLVWSDNRYGNYEVMFKNSSDAGINWGSDVRLTNSSAQSNFPSLASNGLYLHLVYEEVGPHRQSFYKRSTDGGLSWSGPLYFTIISQTSEYPSIASTGAYLHVVWQDDRYVYHARSIDGGLTWGHSNQLSSFISPSEFPSIAISGFVGHIIWRVTGGSPKISYRRTTDGGNVWLEEMQLVGTSASNFSTIAVSGAAIHLAWCDTRHANLELYYKRDPTGNSDQINLNLSLIIEGLFNTLTERLNMNDTVSTYLRSNMSPFEIVDSAQSTIDSVTYAGNFSFYTSPNGSYYIVVKHRNSIETWSKTGGEILSKGIANTYSFTNQISNAFGNNLKTLVSSEPKFGIYSGDINQNGFVELQDIILIHNDAANFATGYVRTDLSGDKYVNLSDVLIAYQNSVNFVKKSTP